MPAVSFNRNVVVPSSRAFHLHEYERGGRVVWLQNIFASSMPIFEDFREPLKPKMLKPTKVVRFSPVLAALLGI